ncbi:MAG: alpha-glucan family phosphorylase, partial [Spirochaetota bacterium]|nr:alpha-glucan family phosphorylase [Spirochaetota bacterium]
MTVREQLMDKMPLNLKGLVDLAYNLWWCWHVDSVELFKFLDPPLWRSTKSNPVGILREISHERLEEMAQDDYFFELYKKTITLYNNDIHNKDEHLWWNKKNPEYKDITIAYLSMEYGLHNSLHIYSGGLGVLAGDYLKESSDLGAPLVAVGFLYQEGFFIQKISAYRNGWQEEIYNEVDFDDLPIEEVFDPDTNQPLIITINLKSSVVFVRVWKTTVGRIALYLMDTNIEINHPWLRDLTDRLYGGNSEMRLQQEMVLGIGAVRLLKKLRIEPSVWHLNEGHCCFSSIERIREHMIKGVEFDEALSMVRKNTVFTTHTPVPAGHDIFPLNLIELYFSDNIDAIGHERFFSLGAYDLGYGKGFNMTVLGIKTSSCINGVSKLHKDVTEKMFGSLWNELRDKDKERFKPLTYVTNGVHIPSYLSNITKEFL